MSKPGFLQRAMDTKLGVHKELGKAVESYSHLIETHRKCAGRTRASITDLGEFGQVEQPDLDGMFSQMYSIYARYVGGDRHVVSSGRRSITTRIYWSKRNRWYCLFLVQMFIR